MVTWENYEEYLLLHVDGELNDADQRALLGFVALHPEVEDELKLYQSTVLAADTTMVYEHKEALLKAAFTAKTIALGQWWKYGVAAGVILFVSVWGFRWVSGDNGDATKSIEIVTSWAAKSTNFKNVEPATTTPKVSQPSPTISNRLRHSATIPNEEKGTSVARNSVHANTSQIAKEVAPVKLEIRTIKPITNEMAAEVTPAPVELRPVAVNKAMTEPSAAQDRPNSNLLAWLPEEKKEGLELLRENVDQKLGKANQIKENIKDTQLALKFGNRELVVINF